MAKRTEYERKGSLDVYGPKRKSSFGDIVGGIAIVIFVLAVLGQCTG